MGVRETLRRAKDLIVESTEDLKSSDRPPDSKDSVSPRSEQHMTRNDKRPVMEQANPPYDPTGKGAVSYGAKKSTTTETIMPDVNVDFAGIYGQANLPSVAFTAEQIVGMLSELPAELPLDTKRRTVKAALNTMGKSVGATPETIVADANRKRAVLASYIDSISRQTETFVKDAEEQVAALQAQIEDKRVAIQTMQNKQVRAVQLCQAESTKLHEVLEFFSDDVPPSSIRGHHTDKE